MRGVAREYGLSTGAAFTDRGLPTGDERPAGGGFAVEIDDAAPIDGVPGCRPVRRADRPWRAGRRPVAVVDAAAAAAGGHAADQPGRRRDQLRDARPRPAAARLRPGAAGRADRRPARDARGEDPDPRRRRARARPRGPAHHRQPGRCARLAPHRPRGGHGRRGHRGRAAATTDLLIEAAHFDPITVARTARRHKLPSEAAKRFERGVDPAAAAGRGRAGGRAAGRARRRRRGRAHRRRPAGARAAVRPRAGPARPARRRAVHGRRGARDAGLDRVRRQPTPRRAPCACRHRPGGPTSLVRRRPGRGGRPPARVRRDPVDRARRRLRARA